VQFVHALVDADRRRLAKRHFNTPERCVVQRVFRHVDVRLGRLAVRHLNFSFFPDARQVQPPRLLQALEEEVRPAEQRHFRRRRVPARQRGQVLVHDRLEQRSDDFLDRHAGLEQGIGVGFRKNPAFAADFVKRVTRVAHFGKLFRGNLQLARGFLDERPGAARTSALHQDLLALGGPLAGEEDRLHVFSADFAHEAHAGMKPLDAGRHGDHFLNNFRARQGSQKARPRPGEENPVAPGREAVLRLKPRKELQDLFTLLGVVPFVGLGDHLAGRRGQNEFARGAAHVHAADHRPIGAGLQLRRRLDFHHARFPHQGRDLNKVPFSH